MKHHPEDFVEINQQISALENEVTKIMQVIGSLIEIIQLQQEQFRDIRKIRELEKSVHKIEHLQKHG